MKKRILPTGLILLLVPLGLQALFCIQLYKLVQRQERVVAEETALSGLVSIEDALVTEFAVGWADIWAQLTHGAAQNNNKPAEHLAHITQLLNQAKTNLPKDAEYAELVAETEQLAKTEFEVMSELDAVDAAPTVMSTMAEMKKVMPRIRQFFGGTKKLRDQVQQIRARVQRARDLQAQTRKEFKDHLLLSICGAILLTAILLVLFLRSISMRMEQVVANAKLLPTMKPTLQQVSGNDEIAYLDTVLHGAAADLRKAAEHRTMVTEMVAHDLRGPLAAAKLTLDQLISREGADKLNLKKLARSMTLLTGFVEDLLTVDKIEAGKLDLVYEPINLHDLIVEVFDVFESLAAAKEISLVHQLQAPMIIADRFRLRQVMGNLISNAIKHSARNSTITVSSVEHEREILLTVDDEGPGVPQSQRERIFDKFVTGRKEGATGYGLGLAICKLIVSVHGGQIGVSSPRTTGCRFWLTLPKWNDDGEE